MSSPDPAPNGRTSARRELVEAQIYEQATRLFAERGFAGTSLQDVADAMGMTRPALYYYVRNKDQLLARLVTEITEGPAEAAEEIAGRDLDATAKLRALVRLIAARQAHNAARFRLVIRSESELPAGPRRRARDREAPRPRRVRARHRPGRAQRRVPAAPGARRPRWR